MTKRDATDHRLETRLVHDGQIRSPFGETSEALFLTQGFIYDNAESAEARFLDEEPGYSYTRYSNPTTTMFEERMAALEGAEMGQATATGMAAVTAAMMGQVKAGDHVVAARALFGSCRFIVEDLLPRFGVGCTLVDGPNLDEWRAAVTPATKAFLLETPSNPSLEMIDIAGVAEDRSCGGCDADGRQCFCLAALPTASWRWGPIASSIPPPSTSTDKADVSAASSWPR